jgi:hypothetical protein
MTCPPDGELQNAKQTVPPDYEIRQTKAHEGGMTRQGIK